MQMVKYKKPILSPIIILSLLFMLEFATAAAKKRAETLIGRVEYVTVKQNKAKITYKARIDTGAGVSSIHAENIKILKDKASTKKLVKFNLKINEETTKTFKVHLADWMQIKNKHNNGYTKRPVVKLKLCLGGIVLRGRFNLADRSNFLYPVLIGRNILKTGAFLVDSRRKFTTESTCD
jgi:hypothetical protein